MVQCEKTLPAIQQTKNTIFLLNEFRLCSNCIYVVNNNKIFNTYQIEVISFAQLVTLFFIALILQIDEMQTLSIDIHLIN